MTKKMMICFWGMLALCNPAQGRDPQWFQRRMGELDHVLLEDDDTRKIESLGGFMGLARYGYKSMDDEQRAIFDKAQAALLAIPGHAQYYQDKIEDVRKQVKANVSLTPEEKERMRRKGNSPLGLGDYESERGDAFQILAQLPSPEAVAVLGHFLEDPEGRDGKDLLGGPIHTGSDAAPQLPNCALACSAITNLGIEHAPISDVNEVDTVVLDPEKVDRWKDWWSEVKAGKRTYRFKGSAIEYGADGPATKAQLAKRENDRKRTEEGRKGRNGALDSPTGNGIPSKTPSLAVILAGFAVLASLVWYFRKAKSP